jgi:hypothetical protein
VRADHAALRARRPPWPHCCSSPPPPPTARRGLAVRVATWSCGRPAGPWSSSWSWPAAPRPTGAIPQLGLATSPTGRP